MEILTNLKFKFRRIVVRVVVIGGTGHIGTYLIPRLVSEGYEVISISRMIRKSYIENAAWKQVRQLSMDRIRLEKHNIFGIRIAELKPDIIIDLICFKLQSAEQLVVALKGKVKHFLHCGTIWTYGNCNGILCDETSTKVPLTAYGKQKVKIEDYLLKMHHEENFPVTILHPGHIVGKGWPPINPAGNLNHQLLINIIEGVKIHLPANGHAMLHHIHSDDLAQAFVQAIKNSHLSVGESYNITSDQALSLVQFADGLAKKFGLHAKIDLLSWEAWVKTASKIEIKVTKLHLDHNSNCSNGKAKAHLNFVPNYCGIQAVAESIKYYLDNERTLQVSRLKERIGNKVHRTKSYINHKLDNFGSLW